MLLIDPSALSFGPSTSNVVATYLGGNIVNFSPGDTIIVANVEQDYANFDKAPSSLTNNQSFDNFIAAAASGTYNSSFGPINIGHVNFYIEPGNTVTTNNALINSQLGASLNSLAGPYLESLDQALFGASSINATLTLNPQFESGSSSIVDVSITTNTQINACFTPGTRIATPRGPIPVEALQQGDQVVTASGAVRPIIWVGSRAMDFTRHPNPASAQPVRIAAGALAPGLPARDLRLSPDHALWLDDVLVPVKELIDGALITLERDCTQTVYYHVELDAHDILLAEGVKAESFLDTGHRALFADRDAPVSLHPDLVADQAMQGRRVALSCAPLVIDGPVLTQIRAGLAARRAAIGYRLDAVTPWLRAGASILAPVIDETGPDIASLTVHLPDQVRQVDLLCASFVPAEIDPASRDRRRLGLAIADIQLDGHSLPIDAVIKAADRHPRAACDAAIWTRGDARLDLGRSGRVLTILYKARPLVWRRAA
ncbi:Hint domain-containing protein [Acidiphilium sp. MT5]